MNCLIMEIESTVNMLAETGDSNSVDMLAITEAAVRALGKPRFNRTVDVRCVDYVGATELGPKRPQMHVFSNSPGEDSGAVDLNQDYEFGLHSQSVNASARSITDSDRSSVLADSAFLTGTAKPVKVSTKRLTEIKSPFDEPFIMQTNSGMHRKDEPVEITDSVNINQKTTEYPTTKSRDLHYQEEGHTVIRGTEDRLDDKAVGSGKMMPSDSIPMLDSGYMTQHVTVIKEVQGQTLETSGSVESGGTAEQQADNTSSSVEEFLVSPQVCGEVKYLGHEVDVLTAPECVQSDASPFTNDMSPFTKGTSLSPGHIEVVTQQRKQLPVNKFAKYQPGCALRQGTLMEGSQTCTLLPQTTQATDVHISQFSLSSRDRALKQALVKKMHKDAAIKKVVQPTLVQLQPLMGGSRPPVEEGVSPPGEEGARDSVASAAAVAAVSAVIATQPFIKAQQNMEQKMTQLLEKLTALPRQATPTCQSTQHATQQETIARLEEKLTKLTDHRLSHLEKMQLIQFQAQLALRNKKVGALAKTHGDTEAKCLPRSTKSADEIYKKTSTKRDIYATDRDGAEMSILNTPAPRSRPPMPTSFRASEGTKATPVHNQNAKKVGRLLEEILAHQEVTPNASPFPDTPSTTAVRSRPFAQSNREVNGFTDVDIRPSSSTTPVHAGRHSNTTQQSGSWQDRNNAAQVHDGGMVEPPGGRTAPIDDYLTKYKGQIPLSPYPSLRDTTVSPTSVSIPYAEAKHVLQGVHNKRNNLEANLDTILRSHYVLPGYEVAPPGSEHQRTIEKMVDERIKAMNADVQREALDELLRVKDRDRLDMIPERDTSTKRSASQFKTKGKVKVTSRVSAAPKPRAGSKVVSRINEKENIPQKKTKQASTRQPSASASEAYLTHVYGKPSYQNQRSTVRDPYLRFQTAPKTKHAVHLPVSPVLVEGVEVATHRTQTDRCWPVPATDQFYFDPTVSLTQKQDAGFGSPIRGQLVSMAVPLAAPRKYGSRHATVHQSSEVMTSTPVMGGHKVAVRFQDEMEQTEKTSKKYPELTEKVLPPVDIDSVPSVVCELREDSPSQMFPGTTVETEEREEEEETFVDGEGAAPFSVPGTKARCPSYHGPQFPPSGATLRKDAVKDVTGMRERELLQSQAVSWIEQELMARVISQMHYDRPDDAMTHDVVLDVSDVSEVIERSGSPPDSFIAETMGEAGLQLFLDAGCAVDNNVVNSLIKEVLLEKITSMTGEQTSRDKAPYQGGHDRHVTSDEEEGSQVESSEVSRVPTPLPTPKLTPAVSRCHSPTRAASRPVPVLPAPDMDQETPTAGSRLPTTAPVKPTVEPAGAPVQRVVEPATVAATLQEPAAAVSRQLEQAAAMVLANTQTMLTHAAAALVGGQLMAPASGQTVAPASGQSVAPANVQPTAIGPGDLEKAVALVLSTAKETGALAGIKERKEEQEEEHSEEAEEEEEEEVDVRMTEELMLRQLRLTTTLGPRDTEKEEFEASVISRHDVSTPSLTPRASPLQFTLSAVNEQVQVPDDQPTGERGTFSRLSPQPWGDPDSPGPEADPNYGTEEQDRRGRRVMVRPTAVSPVPIQPSSPPQAASQSDDTTTALSDDTSYSVTDFVSEGQWLITLRSEGEVLHLPLPPELIERVHEKTRGREQQQWKLGREPSMTDDTLGDTDEFLQEDMVDISRSEGEYLQQRAARSPPHQFAMRVASLRKSLVQEQASVNQAGLATNISLGEVITFHPSLGELTNQPDTPHCTPHCTPHGVVVGDDGEPRNISSVSQVPSISHPTIRRVESSPQPSRTLSRARPSMGQVMSTDHHCGPRPRFKPSSSLELSDEWRTLTPDQMNVEVLLQTNDYLTTTQSDLGSTTNLTDRPPAPSAGELQHKELDTMIKTSSSWQGQNFGEVTSSGRLTVTIPSMIEDYSSITDSASEIIDTQ